MLKHSLENLSQILLHENGAHILKKMKKCFLHNEKHFMPFNL